MNNKKNELTQSLASIKIKTTLFTILICIALGVINYLFIKSSKLNLIIALVTIFYIVYSIILFSYMNIMSKPPKKK